MTACTLGWVSLSTTYTRWMCSSTICNTQQQQGQLYSRITRQVYQRAQEGHGQVHCMHVPCTSLFTSPFTCAQCLRKSTVEHIYTCLVRVFPHPRSYLHNVSASPLSNTYARALYEPFHIPVHICTMSPQVHCRTRMHMTCESLFTSPFTSAQCLHMSTVEHICTCLVRVGSVQTLKHMHMT